MREKREKILIIGGCGFIGSKLFQYLKERDYPVDTVDLELFGNFVNSNNIKKNYNTLTKKFLNNYSVIVLLAGHSSYYMCEKDKRGSFINNVANFIGLVEKLTDQIFIYASSSSVYEQNKKLNLKENTKFYFPSSYYDLNKRILDYITSLSSIKYYGLRFGTVNGVSKNFRTDLMMHRMYEQAKTNRKVIIHNPKIYRSILGINDLCRAILTIIKSKKNPGIYNLSSFDATIEQISDMITKRTKSEKYIDKSFTKSYSYTINSSKFIKTFDFKFKDTPLSLLKDIENNYQSTNKTNRI